MNVMIFGSASLPCSAQYVKNHYVEFFKNDNGRAVKAIVDHHYVDDYVDSFDTIDEAHKVIDKVEQIHQNGNFELRGFVSNLRELLAWMNNSPEIEMSPTKLNDSEPSTEKYLDFIGITDQTSSVSS